MQSGEMMTIIRKHNIYQNIEEDLFILSKQFKTQKLKRTFYSDRRLAQLNETRGRGLHIDRLIYIYISYLFIYM